MTPSRLSSFWSFQMHPKFREFFRVPNIRPRLYSPLFLEECCTTPWRYGAEVGKKTILDSANNGPRSPIPFQSQHTNIFWIWFTLYRNIWVRLCIVHWIIMFSIFRSVSPPRWELCGNVSNCGWTYFRAQLWLKALWAFANNLHCHAL